MSPQPGEVAEQGRTGSPFGITSNEVARGMFGRCCGCNWTTNTTNVVESVVNHVAHFGHDVLIVEHTNRLVCPTIPKVETGA